MKYGLWTSRVSLVVAVLQVLAINNLQYTIQYIPKVPFSYLCRVISTLYSGLKSANQKPPNCLSSGKGPAVNFVVTFYVLLSRVNKNRKTPSTSFGVSNCRRLTDPQVSMLGMYLPSGPGKQRRTGLSCGSCSIERRTALGTCAMHRLALRCIGEGEIRRNSKGK